MEKLIKQAVKEAVRESLADLEITKEEYPDIMNLKQAAKYLKVSTAWLYQNIDSIPHYYMGGHKFVKEQLKQLCISKTGRNFVIK